MFKQEIDRMFTAKVTEYLNKGYRFHTDTMGGSQGEIAKVDLTNGAEIIRVLLEDKFEPMGGERVAITVGRNTDRLRGDTSDTIWNDNLEILEERAFCKVSRNFYVTPEEYPAIWEKRLARREARGERWGNEELGESAKAIVLPFVRRQPKCKRVKACDIERVCKSRNNGRLTYSVKVKGQIFRIR